MTDQPASNGQEPAEPDGPAVALQIAVVENPPGSGVRVVQLLAGLGPVTWQLLLDPVGAETVAAQLAEAAGSARSRIVPATADQLPKRPRR